MLINSYQQRCVRTQTKREAVLRFLRDETWSNLTNLVDVLGLSEPAVFKTVCQMERDGFLLRFKVSALRLSLWGITPQGLAFAWGENETMQIRPYFEPSKLSVMTIAHYLDIQRARLIAERAGWTNWIPGNRLDDHEKINLYYLLNVAGYTLNQALDKVDEPSIAQSSLRDAAEELFDECWLHSVPDSIRYYIDYDKFSRDCEMGGDMVEFEYNNQTYTCTNASGI